MSTSKEIRYDRKGNTEALRPLIIKPKEHASLFKSKDTTQKIGMSPKSTLDKARKSTQMQLKYKQAAHVENKLVFSSHDKAKSMLGSKVKKSKIKKFACKE
jgi:hypothetical protein